VVSSLEDSHLRKMAEVQASRKDERGNEAKPGVLQRGVRSHGGGKRSKWAK
jgi:hypothetical protein